MALIQTDGICHRYRIGRRPVVALRDVTISIDAGEFVAVMGPSGSGKSTLLSILGCLCTPTAGTYRLDGADVGNLGLQARAVIRNQMLGFVFQHFSLLPRATALENVEMPLLYSDDRSSRRSEALALLHEFGLGDRVDHTPEQLSGGQQQRVAIARALINRPAVLFADEPTGALDSDTGREILTLLQHLNRSNHVTVVLVTHEVEIAAYAGRIISLRDGRVATDEVVTKDVRAGQHSNVCI